MATYFESPLSDVLLVAHPGGVNDILLSSRHLRIYDGCEYGCPYCDAWSYSAQPIDERIGAFANLPQQLSQELAELDSGEVVGLDFGEPYQPIEREYHVTHQVLEVLAQRKQPSVIVTKSPDVLEDLTLLQQLNRESFAIVVFTVVSADEALARLLEARAPAVANRLEAVRRLRQAGIPAGVALMPIIPALTDGMADLDSAVGAISQAGPDFVVWAPLWLPDERHRVRVVSLLKPRVPDVESRLAALYQGPAPAESYQESLDRSMLRLCEKYHLAPRIPSVIYQAVLPAARASQLIEKRRAFLERYR